MNPLRFFANAVSYHPIKTLSIFIGDIFQAVFTLTVPFAIKKIIDAMDTYNPQIHGDFNTHINDAFIFFMCIVIGLAISARFSGTTLAFLAPVFRIEPRKHLIEKLQSQSLNFFQNSHAGSLGNRVGEVCNGLTFTLWTGVFDVTPVFIKVATGVTLFMIAQPDLGVIFIGWASVYLSIMLVFSYFQFIQFERISKARSLMTGKIVDMASNIYAVKSHAQEDHEESIIHEVSMHERDVVQKLQYIRESGGWFHSFMILGIMLYMLHACLSGFESQQMSLGDISFILSMLIVLTESFNGFTWSITHFLEYIGQMRDGIKKIYKKQDVVDQDNAKTLLVIKPSIVFDKVHFAYTEDKDKIVFNALDLDIPTHQKIGVVGQSGAGKSTLVSLLLRFYDIQSGSISIDGQDIAKVTQDSLRRNIAVIPQDTSLFHRSLMDNIRYGRLDATDEEVISAAKKAHAHEFIADLPQGYDTMVGERGVKLSGGQRQRIAIARAILKDAPILILDEATSALDSESEKLIQDSLKTLMEGKTVIAIAHRLSTIAHLDRLIVMHEGEIVEDGTHDELRAKKDGHYAKLWTMQSGGFLGE